MRICERRKLAALCQMLIVRDQIEGPENTVARSFLAACALIDVVKRMTSYLFVFYCSVDPNERVLQEKDAEVCECSCCPPAFQIYMQKALNAWSKLRPISLALCWRELTYNSKCLKSLRNPDLSFRTADSLSNIGLRNSPVVSVTVSMPAARACVLLERECGNHW